MARLSASDTQRSTTSNGHEQLLARQVTPFFRWAFFTLLGLTIAFLGFGVALSIAIPNPTETQASAIDTLMKAGGLTLPALIGLFVGKVA